VIHVGGSGDGGGAPPSSTVPPPPRSLAVATPGADLLRSANEAPNAEPSGAAPPSSVSRNEARGGACANEPPTAAAAAAPADDADEDGGERCALGVCCTDAELWRMGDATGVPPLRGLRPTELDSLQRPPARRRRRRTSSTSPCCRSTCSCRRRRRRRRRRRAQTDRRAGAETADASTASSCRRCQTSRRDPASQRRCAVSTRCWPLASARFSAGGGRASRSARRPALVGALTLFDDGKSFDEI
jgi:hypothetical protein